MSDMRIDVTGKIFKNIKPKSEKWVICFLSNAGVDKLEFGSKELADEAFQQFILCGSADLKPMYVLPPVRVC